MSTRAPYSITLHQDEEGDWIARIPELPGCMAYASTEAEAIERARAVQDLWLATLTATEAPPQPVMYEDTIKESR